MTPELIEHYKARMGFAGYNSGTTGGAGGQVVTLSGGGDELQAFLDARKKSKDFAPVHLRLAGPVTGANTKGQKIEIKEQENLTLEGSGEGVDLRDVGILVNGASRNIWLHNLRIEKVKEGPKDCIGFENDVTNFAVTHCDLSGDMAAGKDDMDGLLDVKRGCKYGLIADNYFHNHHKVSLVGHSDSDTGAQEWFLSYHRNFFDNVGSRCPSVRDGFVEIRDNYYRNVETSCINLRMDALAYLDGNVFEGVDDPIVSIDSKRVGLWCLGENLFDGVTWDTVSKNEATAKDGKSTTNWKPDHAYPSLGLGNVKAHVMANAGLLPPGVVVPLPGHGAPEPEPEVEQPPVEEPQPEPPKPADPQDETDVVDLAPIVAELDTMAASIARIRKALGA